MQLFKGDKISGNFRNYAIAQYFSRQYKLMTGTA